MKSITLKIMAGIESRLNTLILLENSHCGDDYRLAKAERQREKLEQFILNHIDILAEKAGEE